jgi:ribosomal protein S19E (S16A)
MSGSPIRKHELAALENLGRAQGGTEADEEVMQRLKALGLAEAYRGGWRLTQSGRMDLQRRKALGGLKR